MKNYIIFDIGGTKTRVARTHDLEAYEEPVKCDAVPDGETGIEKFIEVVKEVSQGEPVTGMAGGLRGVLDHDKTMMLSDPGGALPDWAGKPLGNILSETFDTSVFFENDAAIVGLGEAVFGAGKDGEIVAYHTVSTGVGGAKIEHGVVDEAATGFESGHQVLDIDRSIFDDDTPHTLENLVSGTALEKRRGVKPYEIPQDDPVWDELASYLARGLKNTIVYWSPDTIVLGGSMIVGDPRIFLEDIVRHTKTVLGDTIPCPNIVDATLADEGGLYGAMALLRQRM